MACLKRVEVAAEKEQNLDDLLAALEVGIDSLVADLIDLPASIKDLSDLATKLSLASEGGDKLQADKVKALLVEARQHLGMSCKALEKAQRHLKAKM